MESVERTRNRDRNPFLGLGLILVVAVLGLGSRRYALALPAFIAAYAGDTSWATAAFLGIGLVSRRSTSNRCIP